MAPVRRAQPPRAGQAAGHALPGAFNVTLALSMCLGAAGPGRLVSSSVVIPPELRHTVRLSPDLLADLLGAGSPVSAIRLPARISFASESRRTIHQCLLPDASLSRGVLALPRELAEELSLWQARGPIRAMLDLDTPVVGTLLAEITGHQADGQPPADLALVASEVEQALGRSGDKLHAPVSLCLPSGRVVSIGSLLRLSCAMLPPGHFPHEWCSSDLQQHEGHFVGGVSRVVFRMPAAMVGHVPLACRALALVAGEAAGDAVLLRPVADRGLPTNGMLVSLPVLPPALDRLFGLTCQSLGEALVFDIGGRQFRLLIRGPAGGGAVRPFEVHMHPEVLEEIWPDGRLVRARLRRWVSSLDIEYLVEMPISMGYPVDRDRLEFAIRCEITDSPGLMQSAPGERPRWRSIDLPREEPFAPSRVHYSIARSTDSGLRGLTLADPLCTWDTVINMCPSRLQVVFLAEGPMVQDLSRVAFMHMEISFPGPVAGDYEQYRAKVRHFLTEHRGIVRRDSLVGDIEGHGIIMMRVKRMWDGRWRGTSAGLYSGLTEVLVTCAQGPLEGSPKVVLLGGRAGPVPWGIPLRVFRGAQQHDDVVMPMCTGMQLSRDPGAIAALRVELLGSWLPVVSGEPPGCHVHGRPGGGVPSQAGHPARDAKRRVANGCFPPSLALRPALFDAVFPDAGASLVEAPCNLRYLEEAGSFATVE